MKNQSKVIFWIGIAVAGYLDLSTDKTVTEISLLLIAYMSVAFTAHFVYGEHDDRR